jgi:GT2 family glycosyltransferase
MNRPEDLARALGSLGACLPQPDEVIVSDDSPEADRRTEAVCSRWPGVRYQRGPRRGLGANRNASVATVTADWIHFIDDDVRVGPETYAEAAELIRVIPPRTVITGWQRDRNDRDGSIIPIRPQWHGFWVHMVPAVGDKLNCVVINATLFPRSLFDLARFDEYFWYGCEESDISSLALHCGYRLQRTEALVIDHHPSNINRNAYRGHLAASQVYAGLKRQWVYRRSIIRTVCFITLAVPRLLLSIARRHGLRSAYFAAGPCARGLFSFIFNTRTDRIQTS